MTPRHETTLFYHPNLEGRHLELDPEEARHLKTLRIREGDYITLVDGKGTRATGLVHSPAVKNARIEITEILPPDAELPFFIHISVAPTKSNDRIEWFLEKAIEIGIDKVTLIETQHGIRNKLKGERLWRKGLSAMKQSLRAQMPEVEALLSFEEVVRNSQADQKFIAYTPEQVNLLSRKATAGGSYHVLVGPEGGFSEEELTFATEQGFEPVSLGQSRLRTETAALAACMTLNLINQL